ncbi:type II secretion system protein [Psychrobacillus sp. FSL H8-0487]|uniref:type II secretion system protein n=1 Tax=Psychrobacillus sp. FSL H8-0487 TaxID=2921391 RepID=UPI0030F9749E
MKKFIKILKNQKGLTLIELLAVIVILAIVAAIAVPSIGNIINNSKDKAILADASTILSAGKLAVTDGSCTESSTTKGDYICNVAQLQPYIEGITLDSTVASPDKVEKNSGIWSVTYSKLAGIKNTTKFTVVATGNVVTGYLPPAKVITENALNKAMNQ